MVGLGSDCWGNRSQLTASSSLVSCKASGNKLIIIVVIRYFVSLWINQSISHFRSNNKKSSFQNWKQKQQKKEKVD